MIRKYYHLMGRFVKWVRPPAQFKYGLIVTLEDYVVDDTE